MSFLDAFFGSTQSQFTAYAIFAAVISICISIILTGTDMTIGNRFLLIFFIILAVLPSILLMLLQITCMVTGGNKDDHWWCWLYSWLIAIFVIIYCIFVIIISLSSLFTYNNAISKVDMSEQNNKMTPENSNNYAKMMIKSNSKEEIEKFMNSTSEDDETIEETDIVQNFTNGSNANAFIQTFKNKEEDKIVSSVAPQQMTPPQMTPPQMTPPQMTPSQMTPQQMTPPQPPSPVEKYTTDTAKIADTFSTKEMIDDEPEPFTNRNYATFR